MQKYDILLYKGTSIISKIIRFITKSEYSHSAIVIDECHVAECNIWYSFRIRHISYVSDSYDLYRCKEEYNKDKIMEFIHNNIGSKYDYREILRCLGFKIKDDKNKLICSESVYDCFKYAGCDLLPYNEDGITTPSDISKSKLLEKINKGGTL